MKYFKLTELPNDMFFKIIYKINSGYFLINFFRKALFICFLSIFGAKSFSYNIALHFKDKQCLRQSAPEYPKYQNVTVKNSGGYVLTVKYLNYQYSNGSFSYQIRTDHLALGEHKTFRTVKNSEVYLHAKTVGGDTVCAHPNEPESNIKCSRAALNMHCYFTHHSKGYVVPRKDCRNSVLSIDSNETLYLREGLSGSINIENISPITVYNLMGFSPRPDVSGELLWRYFTPNVHVNYGQIKPQHRYELHYRIPAHISSYLNGFHYLEFTSTNSVNKVLKKVYISSLGHLELLQNGTVLKHNREQSLLPDDNGTLTLKNFGSQTITNLNIEFLDDAHKTDLTFKQNFSGSCLTTKSLKPGSTCTLSYKIKPTIFPKTYHLTIKGDHSDNELSTNYHVQIAFVTIYSLFKKRDLQRCFVKTDGSLGKCTNEPTNTGGKRITMRLWHHHSAYRLYIETTDTIAPSGKQSSIWMCPLNAETGHLDSCVNTKPKNFSQSFSFDFDSKGDHVYIAKSKIHDASQSKSMVMKCDVNINNGQFYHCQDLQLLSPVKLRQYNSYVRNVVIGPRTKNLYLFFEVMKKDYSFYYDEILVCPISYTKGSQCKPVLRPINNSPWDITFINKNKAYVINNSINDNHRNQHILLCNIEQKSGIVQDCESLHDNTYYNDPVHSILNQLNHKLYITDFNGNTVNVCDINSDNTLPKCRIAKEYHLLLYDIAFYPY